MTRIRTNMPAMTAQTTMARANKALNNTMVRLSTGLRINSGMDDPSGLIAANLIRDDVVATEQAIANTERGNLVVQTADSYLSKVTERLDDMRRLITEAANSVAMSPDQIQANQLVMDSSIAAIERIAKTANFQGNKLFDGSMGYNVDDDTSGNYSNLTDVNLQAARLDPVYGQDIRISVTEEAEKATILLNAAPAPMRNIGGEAFTPVQTIEWANECEFLAGPASSQFPVEFSFFEEFVSHDPETEYTIQFAATDYGGEALGQIDLDTYFRDPAAPNVGPLSYGSSGTQTIAMGAYDIFYQVRSHGISGVTEKRDFLIAYNNQGTDIDIDFDVLLEELQAEIDSGITQGHFKEGTTVDLTKGNAQTVTLTGAYVPDVDAANLINVVGGTLAAGGGTTFDQSFAMNIGGTPVTFGASGPQAIAQIGNAQNVNITYAANPAVAAGSYAVSAVAAGNDYAVTIELNNSQPCDINTVELARRMEQAIQSVDGNGISLSALPNITYTSRSTTGDPTGSSLVNEINPVSEPFDPPRNGTSLFDPTDVSGVITDDPYITGGGTAQVGLGSGVKFDAAMFSTDHEATGSLVFRMVTGVPLEVELNLVETDSGYEEGVTELNGRYSVTMFNNVMNETDTIRDLSLDIQKVIAASTYRETFYSTWENLTGDYLIPFNGGPTGTGTVITNKTVSDKSEQDYLTVSAIGTGEDANNITVALEFGESDSVGYDAVQRKLIVTLSDDPDWDGSPDVAINYPGGLTAQMRALGRINGVDFSAASFRYLSDTYTDVTAPPAATELLSPDGERLGITNRRNYETEGSTGITGGYTLREEVTFELLGDYGMEVMTLGKGATRAEIVNAFNSQSDSTGVSAEIEDIDLNGDGDTNIYNIKLQSQLYGSRQEIRIDVLEDKGYFDLNLDRHWDSGEDAVGTINGIQAVAQGNLLITSTSTLQAEIRVEAGTAESSYFNIRDGGALFQLGPEVISSQQKNISLGSLSSGSLGSAEVGYLYMLKTGGVADLYHNTERAARIIEEVITQVTMLSGRLGAFQGTEIETNIYALTDNVLNMRDSESLYRDADYSVESSELAKWQVLTQANTSVLGIANQQSQNVLRLLQ